jgi:hypothetical protein
MRKALVVGINNYPHSPLRRCIEDASEVHNLLERNESGEKNFHSNLKTINQPDSLYKKDLTRLITDLFKDNAEVSLFYFSGHGYITPRGGYIVTQDAEEYDEGVSMQEILNLANKSNATNRIIILDCCFAGNFGNPPNLNDNTAQLSEGLTVLTSSNFNEPSLENQEHGIFTDLLIDALRGGASDLRGNITPGSIYAYVDEALGAWDQRPVFKTNISKFVPIKKINPQVGLSKLKNIPIYFPDPNKSLNLDPSFEEESDKPDLSNVEVFKDLQELEGVGLVIPDGEDHMYWAAMNYKSCKLTSLGYQYWRLANNGLL